MKAFGIFFVCVVVSSSTFAADIVGARSSSLGAAGRAAAETVDAIYLNPAGIGLSEKLIFGSGYSSGRISETAFRETYSATSSDGSPGIYTPGSLGYKYHRVVMDSEIFIEQEFAGGIAVPLGKKLRLGGAYNQVRSRSALRNLIQHNVDVGLHYAATSNWNLGLSAQGLLRPSANVPIELLRSSRWGLSTTFNVMDIIKLRYDALGAIHEKPVAGPVAHHVGLSLILRGFFALNGGLIADDIQGQSWLTTGLIWEGPKLKIGYSYQSESRQGLGDRHLVDLWLDI